MIFTVIKWAALIRGASRWRELNYRGVNTICLVDDVIRERYITRLRRELDKRSPLWDDAETHRVILAEWSGP